VREKQKRLIGHAASGKKSLDAIKKNLGVLHSAVSLRVLYWNHTAVVCVLPKIEKLVNPFGEFAIEMASLHKLAIKKRDYTGMLCALQATVCRLGLHRMENGAISPVYDSSWMFSIAKYLRFR